MSVPRLGVLCPLLTSLLVALSFAACKSGDGPECPATRPECVVPPMGKPGCPSDGLTCNGVCVDLSSDEANCGACGKVCGAGQTCGMGICARRCEGVTTLSPSVGSPLFNGYWGSRVTAGADFNADGRIDFVTYSGVVLGEEGGRFRVGYATPGGDFTGDFTGDGRTDVIWLQRGIPQSDFFISPGKGDGTFEALPSQHVVSYSVYAVGDVDLDGITDVVAVDLKFGAVVTLRGQTTGILATGIYMPVPLQAILVDLVEVTGDGKLDLVLASDTQLSVSAGAGNGTFGAAQLYPLAFAPTTLAFGDLDATGGRDIVASGSQGMTVLRNTGGGTFQSTQALGMRGSVLVADVNGDQKGDLISSQGVITIELSRGDGTFESPSAYRFMRHVTRVVWVGDLVEDSAVDLVVSDDKQGIYVVRGFGDGSFEAEPVLPAGGGLVGAGDFNGDSKPDFAVFDTSWTTMALFLARAQGGFLPPAFYRLGPGALQFTWDFNEDGRTDLLLFDGSQLKVGMLNAAGALEMGAPIDTGSVKAITVGHFDADSHLDLALLDRSQVEVRILAGLGDGRFELASKTAVQQVRNFALPVELSTGDLNADGKTDLILTNGNESLLLGNGDRTFQAERLVRTSKWAFYSVTVADMDEDGHQDLIEAPYGDRFNEQSVLLRRGQGNGTFTSPADLRDLPGRAITRDFDGDGRVDLFQSGDLFLRREDGTYRAVPGLLGFDAAFADFDGDGRLDAVMSLIGGGAQLRSNLLEVEPGRASFASLASVGGVAALDVDLNGQLDLVFKDYAGGLNVARSAAGTGLQSPRRQQVGRSSPATLSVGDFDQDGRVDLAEALFDAVESTLTVLRSRGDGTFEPSSLAFGGYGRLVGQGDLNGDGRPELLTAVPQDGLSIAQFQPGQGLRPLASFPEVDLLLKPFVVMDLNGDNAQDLLVKSDDRQQTSLVPFLQDAAGQFQPREPIVVTAGRGSGSSLALRVADLNGDGVKDVLASTYSLGLTSLLRNVKGGFGDQRPHLPLATRDEGGYVLADFNGDGVLDVVINDLSGGLVLAFGDGAGAFTRPTMHPPLAQYAASWKYVTVRQLAVGDFNADARPDVAVAQGGRVSVLYGTCQPRP